VTGVRVLLGTAAYMSPEQAKGREVDKRSDVWAFGCVLYEMLNGRRAFGGEDVADTLAHVLRGDPDWQPLDRAFPSTIVMLVRNCLQKDRRLRMPTSPSRSSSSTRRRRPRLPATPLLQAAAVGVCHSL
jgi:eukaryotic-like serine/threonine-protein kinase